MHCHHGPDPHRARSVDAAEAVAEAEALGMAAIVLKSHAYPTGPIAILMQKTVQRLRVLGGICCDFEVGGLNPAAVEVALRTGAKVVWMPTFSSVIDRRKLRLPGPPSIPGGMAATEEPMTFANAMMAVGPERAIMSTDFGQDKSPHPADGMRLFIEEMLGCGVPAAAIDLMARRNPARLLRLA